ncbi:MAG: fumarylacetoacetate hydrolase family protein [Myxococcota bacterium]
MHNVRTKAILWLTFSIAVFVSISSVLVCTRPNAPETPTLRGEPPELSIAPVNVALTFAFRLQPKPNALVLVTGIDEDGIEAVPLKPFLTDQAETIPNALTLLGPQTLARIARDPEVERISIEFGALGPVASGSAHIAFGTNFSDHGEEVANERPFAFPKFSEPSNPIGTLPIDAESVLLDYEVELCMRFDRDIRTLEDFDAAQKIVFLCGDFTDRARLLRGIPDDEEHLSGIGFSEPKSGRGMMPTGFFAVVPRDWRTFLAGETVSTRRGEDLMQLASGADMVMDFRQMVSFVLSAGDNARWRFDGESVPLSDRGVIRRGQVLLSGTAGGVLFRPPTTRDIACGAAAYVCLGYFLVDGTPRSYVIEEAISRDFALRRFLQPGERVRHDSRYLGRIDVRIVARPQTSTRPFGLLRNPRARQNLK